MNGKQRSIFALILMILFGLYPLSTVDAHSSLIKVSPKGGQVLEKPPSVIELWFKDAVELHQGSIVVKHQTGVDVQKGKAVLDREDHRHVTIFLQEDAPHGMYPKWQTVHMDKKISGAQ
jgi:methionine-rich copper-binding protein CopC